MKTTFAALCAVLVVALAACGGAKTHQLSTNPKIRAKEKQAQKIVQGCVAKGNFLTHAGRQSVLRCIAPPGKKAQFQACATKAIAKGGFLTKGQRARTEQGIANCVVTVR